MAGRSFWIVVAGAAAVIVTSGFALGAFVIGSFSSNPLQSAAQGAPGSPPGVSWVQAEAQIVGPNSVPKNGTCTATNLGTAETPTQLLNGSSVGVCLNANATGGFATGNLMYEFEVSWSSAAAVSTVFEVELSMSVDPAGHSFVDTAYVETSATIKSSDGLELALDMTQAKDTSLVAFTVLVTQL